MVKQVKESKELRHILESLANSNNKEVKRAAKGAIFQLDQNDTEQMPRKGIFEHVHTKFYIQIV